MKKFFLTLILFLAVGALFGKATIMFIYPAGGKQGTHFSAIVGALETSGITGAAVSGDGVTVEFEKIEDLPPDRQAAAARRDEAKGMRFVKVNITIEANASVGMRDFRLVSTDGSSNRFRFFVGEIDEVSEKEPNDTYRTSQQIASLPVCINGQTYEADKDFYRFKFNSGQTIVLNCAAREIKPYIPDAVPGWFQAVMALYDEQGKQVAYVDDYKISPDPTIIYRVPKTGYYTVEIRDGLFRGRDDFVYRLRVGELPFIDAIFPAGGQLGKETSVSIQGVNLISKKMIVQNNHPAAIIKEVSARNGKYHSNMVKFDVGTYVEYVMEKSNDIPEKGDCVVIPVCVNGIIRNPKDIDWVRFRIEEDNTVLVFETFGRRIGSMIDTKISIVDPNNNMAVLSSNDDSEDASFGLITHHADSKLQFRFKRKGEYLLKIEDAQSHGGYDFVYRLKIERPQEDFRVRITPENPQIAKGDYLPLKVIVFRSGGFEGDVTVSPANLPKGYKAEPCVVPAGKNSALLKLIADKDVPDDPFNPQFVASATLEGKKAVRPVQASEELMQAFFFTHSVPVDKISVSVTPRAPFKVDWGELPDMPFVLQAGGTHSFEIKVTRETGCNLPVRITLLRFCPGMTIKNTLMQPNESSIMLPCTVPENMSGTVEDYLLVMGEARDGDKIYRSMTPLVMRYRAVGK